MPAADFKTIDSVCHGCQTSASDEPKNTITGSPKAAAMCAGPLSLPANREAPASKDFISSSDAPSKQVYRLNACKLSPGPEMKMGSRPSECFRWSAKARKFECGQILSGADAIGCSAA